MSSHLTAPELAAMARLRALVELLPIAFDKRLAPAGLSAFEYTLLETLAGSEGQRMRLSVLAAKTNATLPRISRVSSSLERRGLLQRVACEADGRAINAVLTKEGGRTYRAAAALYEQAVRELVLSGVGSLPGGVEQLAELTSAILSNLKPEPVPGAPGPKEGPAETTQSN